MASINNLPGHEEDGIDIHEGYAIIRSVEFADGEGGFVIAYNRNQPQNMPSVAAPYLVLEFSWNIEDGEQRRSYDKGDYFNTQEEAEEEFAQLVNREVSQGRVVREEIPKRYVAVPITVEQLAATGTDVSRVPDNAVLFGIRDTTDGEFVHHTNGTLWFTSETAAQAEANTLNDFHQTVNAAPAVEPPPLVGFITYHDTREAVNYYDPDEYLAALRTTIDTLGIQGWEYHTISEDQALRAAVSKLMEGEFGLSGHGDSIMDESGVGFDNDTLYVRDSNGNTATYSVTRIVEFTNGTGGIVIGENHANNPILPYATWEFSRTSENDKRHEIHSLGYFFTQKEAESDFDERVRRTATQGLVNHEPGFDDYMGMLDGENYHGENRNELTMLYEMVSG